MKPIMIAAIIIIGTSLNAVADFAEDFQAAKKLLNSKEYQAAHDAFVKLAAAAPHQRGKAPSLSYAAIVLGRLDRYEEAMALAKTIESAPMAAYTQMTIMTEARKPKELAAAFKEEDIAAWPDAINYKGFFMRAEARNVAGDKQGALNDFETCVALAGSDLFTKLRAMERAASLHHALGDDAKALTVYRDALASYEERSDLKGVYLYPSTLLGAAGILGGQKKYDEALALLAGFEVKPEKETRNVWDFLVLEARGDSYAAQGNKAEALAHYRDALGIQTHQGYMDRVEKKLAELENGGEKPR